MNAKNKPVALVTGASSGMGQDVALALLAQGYVVYGAARRQMPQLQAAGGHELTLDVTDDAALVAAVREIVVKQGRIDVLINAAGYGQYGAIEDVPMGLARRQIDVNLFAAARLSQLVLPQMRAQGSGRIIMISSIGGKIFSPLGGWYSTSKFALEGYADTLRNEVRAFGVGVVLIEPGAIETEFMGTISEAKRLSGNSAYASLYRAFDHAMSATGKGSPPSVVTALILKAIKAKRPKARYAGGKLAAPLLFLRNWLPDGAFDRLVMLGFRPR